VISNDLNDFVLQELSRCVAW